MLGSMRSVRHARAALAAVATAMLAAGCTATLHDGGYSCPAGSACPPNWYCWMRDRTCHAAPEPPPMDVGTMPMVDAGGPPRDSGMPPQDAFVRVTLGTRCTDGSMCSSGETCVGPDTSNHFCLHGCAGASCPGGEMCIMGDICLQMGCSPVGSQGNCPTNFTCRTDPMGHATCFPNGWP